jgi:hypothetical protein
MSGSANVMEDGSWWDEFSTPNLTNLFWRKTKKFRQRLNPLVKQLPSVDNY